MSTDQVERTYARRLRDGGGWFGLLVLFGVDLAGLLLFLQDGVAGTGEQEAAEILLPVLAGLGMVVAGIGIRRRALAKALVGAGVLLLVMGLLDGGFAVVVHALVASGALLASERWQRARDAGDSTMGWAALTMSGLGLWALLLLLGIVLMVFASFAS